MLAAKVSSAHNTTILGYRKPGRPTIVYGDRACIQRRLKGTIREYNQTCSGSQKKQKHREEKKVAPSSSAVGPGSHGLLPTP